MASFFDENVDQFETEINIVLGLVTDRDVVTLTPAAGFTSRVNTNYTYFANNLADKVFGSTTATGNPVWAQSNGYPAAGLLMELLAPPLVAPVVTSSFNPATIVTGNTSTLTMTVVNTSPVAHTNVQFADALAGLTVAGTTLGGTCVGTTNSPALTVGATSLALTIPSVAPGSCTVTVQVTGTTGNYTNAAGGVTTTQVPTPGSAGTAGSLNVIAQATPPSLGQAFLPAWTVSGAASTLTYTLTSPSSAALSNIHFTATLTNLQVASTTIGGTCVGASNSPALAIGLTGLDLTIPALPANGCTVTVQVSGTTLGSQPVATTGATATEASGTGAVPAVAYLTVTAGNDEFYYVHADHLGTPRAITRPSDNAVVWKNENTEPFGNSVPNEDPSGLGNFKFNLRFPGQYYDAETGTHYNYFRDYDPSTGRYIESDPAGLVDGPSTYAYVGNSPIAYFDDLALSKQRGAKKVSGDDPLIRRDITKNTPQKEIDDAIKKIDDAVKDPKMNPKRKKALLGWKKVAKRGFTKSFCPPFLEELALMMARQQCLMGDLVSCQTFEDLGGEVIRPSYVPGA